MLFSPATENKPVVAVDKSLGIEEFEREIDNYIENLGSLGGPGVNRPPKPDTIGVRALAGDLYPAENKDAREPASDPKVTKERVPVFPNYDFNRDYVEPTPPAMLREGENAGGARRKVPSIQRFQQQIAPPPCCGGVAKNISLSLRPPALGAWARAPLGSIGPCLVWRPPSDQ